MSIYMVERDLTGITHQQLAQAQQAAIATADAVNAEGRPVRYVRSTFVPGEARCMCLFSADDAAAVKEVNDRAGLPYTRIVEALDLTP